MNRRTVLVGAVASCIPAVLSASCKRDRDVSGDKAVAAKQGLTADQNPQLSADDRCPMCAMSVANNPTWVGAIVLRDGSTYYGCSVRCTLAICLSPEKFLGVTADQVARVRVPDYLHAGIYLDADDALYVVDSDVRGPMGLAVVPAGSDADAAVIVKRHGGRTLRRGEVTMDVLKALTKRSAG